MILRAGIRLHHRSAGNAEETQRHYADAYGDPDRLRSAFEIYRALPAGDPVP
jgi:hypothetical protein